MIETENKKNVMMSAIGDYVDAVERGYQGLAEVIDRQESEIHKHHDTIKEMGLALIEKDETIKILTQENAQLRLYKEHVQELVDEGKDAKMIAGTDEN